MARREKKLTARTVATLKKRGRYGDGGGLWLQVSPGGTKSWLFRYMQNGRARQMGLGPVDVVGLADARHRAWLCRRRLLDGIDPIEARRADGMQARLEAARGKTFKECAEAYITSHAPSWRNEKHRAQWRSTLKTYVYPVFGDLSVASVDTGLVLKVLEPMWLTTPETGTRVRGRIESILDWATARAYRTGENAARWRGHLDKVLPARAKVSRVKHHPALPYGEIPVFMARLRAQEGVSARALEFTILTATRTSETIRARWDEIGLDSKMWTIPGERMKAGKGHRVPLSERAMTILKGLPREGGYVFPGGRAKTPLSSMALLMTLRRMGRDDITTHGFRSTFRDWAAETTAYPRDVAEMALAHAIADKVEAAYRRGDLFAKRRELMDAWATYCAALPGRKGQVVPMRERGRG